MGRDILGDIDLDMTSLEDSYEQGSSSLHPLLEDVFRGFLREEKECELRKYNGRASWIEREIIPEIASQPGFDPHTSLEVLMVRLEMADASHQKYGQYLIRPLIRGSYRAGDNDFLLDYRNFSEEELVGRRLSSSNDNPLRLRTLLLEEGWKGRGVGYCLRHSEVSVIGKTVNVGLEAQYSSFFLEQPPVHIGGNKTQHNSFYLEGVQDGQVSQDEATHKLWYTQDGLQQSMSLGWSAWWSSRSFFQMDNHLYIRGDGGGWQEIRPED